jgi:anti-anti-sigma regulatory factor
MPISIDEGPASLRLTGELEICDAESVSRALANALANRPELKLDLRGVTTCDAAGAQILWSARKTGGEIGKLVHFEHVPGPVLEAWSALGMPAEFFTSPPPPPHEHQ